MWKMWNWRAPFQRAAAQARELKSWWIRAIHRSDEPFTFDRVQADEFEFIEKRRGDGGHNPHGGERDLTALALSGGGIRSATFSLGVIQALAELGLLKRFDYLSTVSGGGYIGAWMSAWIKREAEADAIPDSRAATLKRVELQLSESRRRQRLGRREAEPEMGTNSDSPPEPHPLFHLRKYSNYLAPRFSLGSPDVWVMMAIYSRNFLLNQAILLSALISLIAMARALVTIFADPSDDIADELFGGAAIGGLGICYAVLMWQLIELYKASVSPEVAEMPRYLRGAVREVINYFMIPLLIGSVALAWMFATMPATHIVFLADFRKLPLHSALLKSAAAGFVLWLSSFVVFRNLLRRAVEKVYQRETGDIEPGTQAYLNWAAHRPGLSGFWRRALWWALVGAAIGVLAGGFVYVAPVSPRLPESQEFGERAAFWLTLGPPALWLLISLLAVVQHGLYCGLLEEDDREWTASIASWLMIAAYRWILFFGIVFYGPACVIWIAEKWYLVNWALVAGWLASTAGGVLAGRSPRTGEHGSRRGGIELVAQVAPFVFLVGLLVLASAAIDRFTAPTFHKHQDYTLADYFGRLAENQQYWEWLAAMACAASAAFVASFFIGVNTFSLQRFYQNRLVRCYLGASRPFDTVPNPTPQEKQATATRFGAPTNVGAAFRAGAAREPINRKDQLPRRPNPITGFARHDDFGFPELGSGEAYPGPYLLINTALNLVGGSDLAWQERKAESFVLSPRYCGCENTGFRLTDAFAGGLSLGTAFAISGAAFTSNMGYHSSPPVTALMTFFNVRLGGWFGNPNYNTGWDNDKPFNSLMILFEKFIRKCTRRTYDDRAWAWSQPTYSLALLIKELFGQTDRYSTWVYLSDGGHFENLGIYELVRRRVRFIVACDGDEDPRYEFADLGGMIRKCRSDFGVPIEIDVERIRQSGGANRSTTHCAVGVIRYDLVDRNVLPGILVYLKTSLTGDEPSDVLNYAVEHNSFPHQSTMNQFFTESQFEAYRALGQHIGRTVFEPAMRDVFAALGADPANNRASTEYLDEMSVAAHRDIVRQVFRNVRKRWTSRVDQNNTDYLGSVDDYLQFIRDLRKAPGMASVAESIYPEAAALAKAIASADTSTQRPVGATRPYLVEYPAVAEMLQVLEVGWFHSEQDEAGNQAPSRGWMNLLRRWSQSDVFRRYWLVVRGEFTQEFIRFCEDELNADPGRVRLAPFGDKSDDRAAENLSSLSKHFQVEWPSGYKQWEAELGDANPSKNGIWIVSLESTDVEFPFRLPVGFIVLRRVAAWGDPASAAGEPGANRESIPQFEAVVWIAGAFRHLGVGAAACREFFSGLDSSERRPAMLGRLSAPPGAAAANPAWLEVRMRYPLGNAPGRSNRRRRDNWLSFFQFFDFRETGPNEQQEDLVISRRFGAAQAN